MIQFNTIKVTKYLKHHFIDLLTRHVSFYMTHPCLTITCMKYSILNATLREHSMKDVESDDQVGLRKLDKVESR